MSDNKKQNNIVHPDHPVRGILLILSSTIFLSVQDAFSKYLSKSLPGLEITWLRFMMFALLLSPVALRSPSVFRSSRPLMQVARGAGVTVSAVFFISSLRFLRIAEATATAFVAPIFVTALSILFLRERIGLRRWFATIIGLAGVLIIIRPGSGVFQLAALLPVISAMGWANALVITRLIGGKDGVATTMVYTSLVGSLALMPLIPFVWVRPDGWQLLIAAGVGIFGMAGQTIVVFALRYARASVLAPFTYTQLVWAAILGFLVFGEIPDGWTFVGAAIIIFGGLYTAHRERLMRGR